MSRVGKSIINIPNGVKFEIIYGDDQKRLASVTGPLGVLLQEIKPCIWVEHNETQIELKRENDEALSRSLHGLYNRLINNMIEGVTKGFTKTLIMHGVGYKARIEGDSLILNLGYSHPCTVKVEEGIKFKVCTPAEVQNLNLGKDGIGVVVQVSGSNKERVGAMAAKIRQLRKVEPYHMYGIRYSTERVIRKESKSGKKSGGGGAKGGKK
jgi:large subunit ribosomal protein L6